MPDSEAPTTPIEDTDLMGGVRRIIELMRPAIQADGGDLELVGVTGDGVVRVRFHGACVGCPSSSLTLHSGIERNLKQHVPGVTLVEAVE